MAAKGTQRTKLKTRRKQQIWDERVNKSEWLRLKERQREREWRDEWANENAKETIEQDELEEQPSPKHRIQWAVRHFLLLNFCSAVFYARILFIFLFYSVHTHSLSYVCDTVHIFISCMYCVYISILLYSLSFFVLQTGEKISFFLVKIFQC